MSVVHGHALNWLKYVDTSLSEPYVGLAPQGGGCSIKISFSRTMGPNLFIARVLTVRFINTWFIKVGLKK